MKVQVKKLAVRKSIDVYDDHVLEWLTKNDQIERVDNKNYYDGLFGYVYYKVRTKGGTIGYVRRDAVK